MWSNTKAFSEEAQHFLKYGFYTPEPIDSPAWHQYWDEQERRCIEGYQIGGQRITGQHYWYLNFKLIQLTDDSNAENKVKKDLRSGGKIRTFPDFWDGDAVYFQHLEDAWKEGKHVAVLKTRRRGYSYKNSSLASWAYSLIRKSQTYLCAYEKELYKQLVSMTGDQLNFLIENTGFGRTRDYIDKTSTDGFHVESSYKKYMPDGRPIKKGYLSTIQALTFKDNADAARGKDARFVLWEEAGSFSNLKASWKITQPSLEDGIYITGQMIAFGTGGDMNGGADFIDMFYNPEPYRIKSIENIWDEGMQGTQIGFFVPDTMNKKGFIDAEGNSDEKAALEYITAKREHIKRTSKDPLTYDRELCEYPLTPKEASLSPTINIFPTAELLMWQNEVKGKDSLRNLGNAGTFEYDVEGKLVFRHLPHDSTIRPVIEYPIIKAKDRTGCPVIYWHPYRIEGVIPPNMYIVSVDPYDQDSEHGQSVGAAYVVIKPNPFSKPDDCIVAQYVGRPNSQDEFNRIVFMLAEYYNAKIDPETDAGDIIKYARKVKKMHMLIQEWDIADKTDGTRKLLGRGYGHSLNGERRKSQAEIYLRDWLLAERSADKDGERILNLHTIYDIGLLEELIKYRRDGNFDRVSAMLGAASYLCMEAPEKPIILKTRLHSDDFFTRDYFTQQKETVYEQN